MSSTLPLALSDALSDWLDLGLRWLHVIAAMAWIGTSFYFVLLDQSLRPPRDAADAEAGVGGELWEVHGGGFYQVQKYVVAPRVLPEHVAWFKWEAYTTWLSGFALMLVLYYLEASSALVKPGDDLEPWLAVAISVALLAAAWIVYDLLNRFVSDARVLWTALFVLVALSAWGSAELFSPRAAWLQVGGMIGTVMAANVLFDIIPAHWELIRAKEAGREPDPRPGIQAKQRSVHNNYLTLPVLLTMLAGHFPFAYGADHAWLVLVGLMAIGAWARLFYNLRHSGRTHWWMTAAGAAAFVAVALLVERGDETVATPSGPAAVAQGQRVFASAGCGVCHTLADAGATGTVGPSLDSAKPSASLVADRVRNGQGAMPAFDGRLTDEQIDAVAAYVSGAAAG
ncbi:MAG TPA: urate hydroxylase PuuD [Gaiella sp.]|uniref:urate hydroxylase PuuD n=1 Tax=Gaiella sp. TaxID=2663207 RepID=UPI002D8009F6|nr:urate hydroxylase PuuD [Gaiella sp.]HET9285946.1 urate hydroxylase PuuD [Gaiella sp.]